MVWNPYVVNAADFQGLFGFNTGTLENVQISMDGMYSNVFGVNFVGSLAGANDTGGIIRNVVAMMDGASIRGTGQFVGGLVGANAGTILNSHVVPYDVYGADIHSTNSVGGLVGENEGAIYNSSASFDVVGQFNMALGQGFGGLVGVNNGAIAGSYASGSVNPSYAEGVGGLVGMTGYDGASIADSYATGTVGNVSATNANVGGLVGYLSPGTSVTNSYAAGAVVGQSHVGGLVGYQFNVYATVTNSYWDTQVSGQATSDGGTGKTSAELTQAATFAGWDISTTGGSSAAWRIYDSQTTPLLRSFLTPMSVTANNVAKNYDATPYSGGNGVLFAPAGYNATRVAGSLTYAGSSQGATAIGSYTITPDGLFSDQLGYDISFISGALNINGYWLTLAISGNGTVNSSNGSGLGYACNTATCSAVPFGSGDTVTLTATGSNSSFSSWSGDYVSISNPGSITMNADKAVTATFSPGAATVKIDGDNTPYYSINTALAAPVQDAVVRATATNFTEDVTLQSSVTVTLKGGYSDATFTDQTGYSTINGSLTISSGTLVVDKVMVGP
ncbi:GLUG motif-containing protein [Trichlorobacter thiogenes]|uniref:GLUG motif-containing protein n=1 Tax=Trichlorobacter thiogenes TaxID=115783 RepID=UPI00111621D4|nr:GLUG motif-containing protein [Trichlorobacter thiogenes]